MIRTDRYEYAIDDRTFEMEVIGYAVKCSA